MPEAGQRSLATLALVLTMVLAAPAMAQSPDVVALFEDGLAAYRDGRYEDAEALFSRAHALEPIADLTYNRARALENLGRFGDAADAYETFLAESPSATDRTGIEARIASLRARDDEERRLAEENEALRRERDALSERPVTEPRAEDPAPWVL